MCVKKEPAYSVMTVSFPIPANVKWPSIVNNVTCEIPHMSR